MKNDTKVKRGQVMPRGRIKRIHVNRHVIAKNLKTGENEPVMTIQTSYGPVRARKVVVHGTLTFDQDAKQLSCGARLYGETLDSITYFD